MANKRNKWTKDEINSLVSNYEQKGVNYICNLLPTHTRNSVTKKAKALGLKVDISNYHYDENTIRDAVLISFSYKEVFRKLNKVASGDSYKCLINYMKKRNIDTSHFDPWKNNKVRIIRKPIEEWLQKGTTIGSSDLKEKLYKLQLKQPICELCGQDEWWHGKKMALILDHINGVNNDNRLENLRIVCPNCEGTLETHCRGYKQENVKNKIFKICKCGNEIKGRGNQCTECSHKKQRKVERPSTEFLLNDIKFLGYNGTGRKYGVSDNSIRKWIKVKNGALE